MEGWFNKISQASLGWLILMGKTENLQSKENAENNAIFSIYLGLLYILGAVFYALRVPERWFPGKFDLWVFIFIFNSGFPKLNSFTGLFHNI